MSLQQTQDPFERRYAIIQSMDDGPAKTEAMRQLFQDYPGKLKAAQDKTDKGFKLATMKPAGMTEGNRANPFAVDVGAGIAQHAGNAGMAYLGGKDMREGRDTAAKLSADQDAAGMGEANGALQMGQTAKMRGEVGPDGLTGEERRQRMMMMG